MPARTEYILNEIRSLFEKQGRMPCFGEEVSLFEHAAQAADLARRDGFNEEVQVAAFLHDIGHMLPTDNPDELMDEYGRRDHENVAAAWLLERGFTERVGMLIENHVNAKRYLTWKSPTYFAALSNASLQTLTYQGGPMSEKEALIFENNLHFDLLIRMRRWDEAAKKQACSTSDLEHYLALISRYLEDQESE
jgi:2-amino-1-hydroxyethylphosphonate dioxygenase (glycine-forming)